MARPAGPEGGADAIIARAAPPPERADGGAFEPAAAEDGAMERRRGALAKAFGSADGLAAHAEALGLGPEEWTARFGDVRLAGPDPDWAREFRAIAARLSDGPLPFAEVRRWARETASAALPAGLELEPDALEGPLDLLASRLGTALAPTFNLERRLGAGTGWAERFRRSPALAHALGRVTADWRADLVRTLGRAAADRALLARDILGGRDPGPLVAVEPGLGDPHAGGQSVAILRFRRGAVVYKPKDLRISAAVAGVVDGLGGGPGGAGLAAPQALVRDGYAWEPVHEARPVADGGGADAFFASLGGWLALLQALGATDFWFDNLVADGAVARFVDFETAVQPPPPTLAGAARFTGDAAASLGASPMGVGILPMLSPVGDGVDPTDLGCLARPGEHATPLSHPGTRERIVWSEARFAPHGADGRRFDAADHFEAFEEGYLRTARLLDGAGARGRIEEALGRVADAPVRIIRIDTWSCYRMIHSSVLPANLADGAWREIALHAALGERRDMAGALREAAVRDLRRLDIPLFQAALGGRDLVGTGGERGPGFIETDALSALGPRMRRLSGMAEGERRAWLRSGFSLRDGNPPRRRPGRGRARPAGPGDLLAWADEIATTVAGLAVRDGRGAPDWVGLYLDVFTGWRTLGPIGFDMLSGRAGLAGALDELGRALGRSDLSGLAREALEGAARDYADLLRVNLLLGAGRMVGAGGLVTALAGDPELRPLAVETYGLAASHEVWMRSGDDIVSGLAGWREAALALGEEPPAGHGAARPYAPSALPRLARWLAPEGAAPLCRDRAHAARMRRDRDRHGGWFAERWLDERHDVSGADGLPALAVRFTRLAREAGG